MKGDVMCECPWAHVASSCVAGVTKLSSARASNCTNRQRRHWPHSSPVRRQRPHSSPVRTFEIDETKSQALPSLAGLWPPSPVRLQGFPQSPSPTELFSRPSSPERSSNLFRRLPASASFPASIVAGRGSAAPAPAPAAYFSARPPAAPLLLVPAALSPTLTATTIQNKPLEKNVKMVHTLLKELVNALPLSVLSTPGSAASVHETPVIASYKHSRLSSESSMGGDGSLKCHVSTQARANGALCGAGACDSACGGGSGSADEWLGGVRALRDSHVRLVRRQLRHIDRLNRALDRARAPAPAPAQ